MLFSSHQLELVERLCDEVSIIVDGTARRVGAGRSSCARRPRTASSCVSLVEGAPPTGTDALPESSRSTQDARGVVLRLPDGVDDQQLLDAARAAGRVHRFAPAEPTLAELFREAVAQP